MKITIIFSLCIIIFSAGCNTTRRTPRVVNTTNPAISKAVTQHDEQIAKLTFQFNQIRENNKSLIEHINRLNKEMALLKRKIGTIEKTNKLLADQLKAEKLARQNDIDRLLKEVAKQTAAAMNARKNTKPSNTSTNGPAGQGEFYEYTVQQGATLGAIARAYKVTVSDIKKANKLKSDMIRVGQKLYIPKK